jgi:hypothetical protein
MLSNVTWCRNGATRVRGLVSVSFVQYSEVAFAHLSDLEQWIPPSASLTEITSSVLNLLKLSSVPWQFENDDIDSTRPSVSVLVRQHEPLGPCLQWI